MRTFIDAGVLIAAARGEDAPSINALEILDDQSREFVSSPFIVLEVLPKAIYNRKEVGRYRFLKLPGPLLAPMASAYEKTSCIKVYVSMITANLKRRRLNNLCVLMV